MDPDWRCNSYWTWWYSIAMLVYWREKNHPYYFCAFLWPYFCFLRHLPPGRFWAPEKTCGFFLVERKQQRPPPRPTEGPPSVLRFSGNAILHYGHAAEPNSFAPAIGETGYRSTVIERDPFGGDQTILKQCFSIRRSLRIPLFHRTPDLGSIS